MCPLQEQQLLLFLTFELSLQPLTLLFETKYYHVVQARLELTLIFCLRFQVLRLQMCTTNSGLFLERILLCSPR